jgi:two-component system sensor histidine kinase UhpB
MGSRYVSLFWRLLVPNVMVLCVACVVLSVQPANGRVPALAGGLAVMIVVNVVLLRRAIVPLIRMTSLMQDVEPLRPGQRLPAVRPPSELTLLTDAFNDMLDRVETERRESGLRALSERESERRRVAGELHDQIGQNLTALGLQVDRILMSADDSSRREIRDVRDGILGAVEDVRRIASELRPEGLDTLGLVPALTNLSERMTRRTGIDIRRRLDHHLPPIDGEAELVVYRIAQESLTNAVRHAAPKHIEIALTGDGAHVVLAVSDDGVGYRGDQPGGGIRGMRERALSIGAQLRIEGQADGPGTRVVLRVPT